VLLLLLCRRNTDDAANKWRTPAKDRRSEAKQADALLSLLSGKGGR